MVLATKGGKKVLLEQIKAAERWGVELVSTVYLGIDSNKKTTSWEDVFSIGKQIDFTHCFGSEAIVFFEKVELKGGKREYFNKADQTISKMIFRSEYPKSTSNNPEHIVA